MLLLTLSYYSWHKSVPTPLLFLVPQLIVLLTLSYEFKTAVLLVFVPTRPLLPRFLSYFCSYSKEANLVFLNYSRTCREWPLSWATTCPLWTDFIGHRTGISRVIYLGRPSVFYSYSISLSRQVRLHLWKTLRIKRFSLKIILLLLEVYSSFF